MISQETALPIGMIETNDPAIGVPLLRKQFSCQCFRAPCDCAGTTTDPGFVLEKQTMELPDLVSAGQLVNDEFQQWYVLTHPGVQIPTQNQGEIRLPGVTAGFNTNILIIGLVIVAAVVLLRN